MTAHQNAYLQMFAAMKATIDAHNAAWASFVPFADAYTQFEGLLQDADAAIALQQTSSEGASAGKKTARTSLSGKLMILANALVLHGNLNNMPNLVADARTTPSSLKLMREKTLVGHAKKLYDLASDIPPDELASYNLPSGFLVTLQADIDTFSGLIGTPRHQQAESIRGTQALDNALQNILELFEKRLDPAAAVLGATQSAFYSEYDTAREIIDPGYTVRELTVEVTDAQTGEALPDVRATITPGDIIKQTASGGSFYIDDLDAGEYSMELVLPGYTTKAITFHIVDGQATTVTERLTPINGGTSD